jgi:adenine-specific DNA-methyltransferase
MYPRLKLARNLLTDDGVIAISIDDNEVVSLRKLCEEIFGESNFLGQITWQSTQKNDPKYVAINHEYILLVTKNIQLLPPKWRMSHPLIPEMEKFFLQIKKKHNGDLEKMQLELREELKKDKYEGVKHYKNIDLKGIYFAADISDPQGNGPKHEFVIHPITGKVCKAPTGGYSPRESEMRRRLENDEIHFGDTDEKVVCYKKYFNTAEERLNSVYYEDGRRSSKALKELFDGFKIFEFPKSEILINKLIGFIVRKNDIVLDFFAGSSSTAHAVLNHNSNTDNSLRYIMVQIPELTDVKSEAFKQGYLNICEIGKERIRRAANKNKVEKLQKAESEGIFANFKDIQDYGFRVYRLSDSNMHDVYYKPQDYKQSSLELFSDNVKTDRTADDLLAQVMLDWGLPLSLKIEQVEISGKQVFKVAENSLYACFDKNIDEHFAKELATSKPLRVVFRDAGFKDDTAKTNVNQLLKQLSPETEMKVI